MSLPPIRTKCQYDFTGKSNIDGCEYCCPWCGHKRWSAFPAERLIRDCPKAPDLKPAAEKIGVAWSDVEHYAQALAKWMAAGFPCRDQADVERILETLCKPCKRYRKGRCKQCRCCVSKSRIAVVNKIKMATESCPEGKW